jgi:lysophospholipase L1-like esterase
LLLSESQPITWLFTGDSITQGAFHTVGWRGYPELFAERVRWELQRPRDVVINTGISGDTTSGLLGDLEWRALRFRPHVFSLNMGMNDCVKGPDGREEFRCNLHELARVAEDHGSIPLFHTPNAVFPPAAERRRDLAAYVEIIRGVAEERKALLVDHFAHWSKTHANKNTIIYWLHDGSIHPNVYGHRELANLIFKTLGIYDPTSPTCQFYVP